MGLSCAFLCFPVLHVVEVVVVGVVVLLVVVLFLMLCMGREGDEPSPKSQPPRGMGGRLFHLCAAVAIWGLWWAGGGHAA